MSGWPVIVRFFITMVVMICSTCNSATVDQASRLKIDKGASITQQNRNRAPAILFLRIGINGVCTGTAVSHNTVMYAAHCSDGMTGRNGIVNQRVCILDDYAVPDSTVAGLCAQKVYIHPSYRGGADWGADLAVALFPDHTFKHYIAIQPDPPSRGMDVVMVGFSTKNLERMGVGSKRWGYNTIQGFYQDTAIVTNFIGSVQGVALSPGDSGGPMLSDCRLIGVASRGSYVSPKISLHTNLSTQRNLLWLQTLQREEQANFCGLTAVNQTQCLDSQMASPDYSMGSGRQVQELPCSSEGGGGGSFASTGPFLALGESNGDVTQVFVAAQYQDGLSAKVCQGSQACVDSNSLGIASRQGDMVFFDQLELRVTAGMMLRIEIYSNSGQPLGHKVVRLNNH